jgi:hypothetical protein
MTVTEITSKRGVMDDDCAAVRPFAPIFDPTTKRRTQHLQVGRFLITLMTVAIAGLLGRAMWGAYMGTPWTRDATVRAYVVMMAPEVSGRIVELHVVDNKYVRCIATALIAHTNLADPNQMVHSLKNLAMTGGFLQLAAFGGGAWSIDFRSVRALQGAM